MSGPGLTPKASFVRGEGRLLKVLFWGIAALFVGIMVATWVAAERARPVMLDLDTGKPVARRPAL